MIKIWNLWSIGLLQVEPFCPNSPMFLLHCAQQFACLHGINIHVLFCGWRQTRHKFVFEVSSSSFTSESSDHRVEDSYTVRKVSALVDELLVFSRNCKGIYIPLTSLSLHKVLCSWFILFFSFWFLWFLFLVPDELFHYHNQLSVH